VAGHRLDPLLRPKSIAVVGASTREHSVGERVMSQLVNGGYGGDVYPINPRYDEIEGIACLGDLHDLPGAVDLAVLAVGNQRLEEQLDIAISRGIPAAVIFSSLYLEDDVEPRLVERIRAKSREAGISLCGGNCMGFYNFADKVQICGYDTRDNHRAGNIALISHSGSAFAVMGDCDERLEYSFMVSAGQELVTTAADYLDFAVEMPETEVVGLFMETVRDPDGFIAALEKANARDIPIVAVKIGRTEAAARLAQSHSGAMAGNDAAYEALFDRYGVMRVNAIDELASTLTMFAQPHRAGPGGLATIHDSGGERALLVDLADDAGVAFADLAPETLATIKPLLGPGLPAVNPLDAWDTIDNYSETIIGCLGAMMADPATAVGAMIGDRSAGGGIWSDYHSFLAAAQADTGKPVFLVSNHHGTGADPLVVEMTRQGIPALDGVGSFLEGVRCLFEYRDHRARPAMMPPTVADDMAARWRERLKGGALDTAAAMALLDDFSIPTIPTVIVGDRDEAVSAAGDMGYPVALKTAAPAIAHKTEVSGVHLGLGDSDAVGAAYDDLATRLGSQVALSPMADAGVEMILGVINDAQFGPIVMIGTGGVHAETIGDAVFALPPFDEAWARRMVDRLALRPLLDGVRGAPPVDIDGLCRAAAQLSVLAAALGDAIDEIDINPLIVGPTSCMAVDALVVPTNPKETQHGRTI